MTLTREQSTWLKIIAIILMIVDHIGVVFFPEEMSWRIIGRLAFPLFAYQLAVGFQFTRNRQKQWLYLLAFAVISQLPYMLALGIGWDSLTLNVFFTFALSYLLMMLWVKPNKIVFLTLLAGILLVLPSVDYGLYGILLPVAFYWLRNCPLLQVVMLILATFAKSFVGSPLQLFAIFAIALVALFSRLELPSIHLSKWFFYGFYPAHLGILAFLSYLMVE